MSDPGFGLYLHWPYCAAICPYCDFNVYRDRGEDRAALVEAMIADVAAWRARTGPRTLTSIYFGGGTPSRLAPADAGRLIEAAANAWDLPADAEVTLEANPDDADAARFQGFRAAGVNRVSVGVQSFDDRALADLGRWHSAADARAALDLAMTTFPRVTFDLIYARHGQTLDAWRAELGAALTIGAEHLSLYQLTIEPGTAFAAKAARGAVVTPDEDGAADFFDVTQELCVAAGLPAYEVSNHAAGAAARSAHNLIYWRGGEWAGVGPGAHGRLGALGAGRRATSAHRKPADYVAAVKESGWGVAEAVELERVEQAREMLIMGLRLVEGLDLAAYARAAGTPLDAEAAAALSEQGLLAVDDVRARITPAGRALVDRIALELAPD